MDRKWYWIAGLLDPRERMPHGALQSSLAFMPETLMLDSAAPCYFKSSGAVRSNCLIIAGATGPDGLHLAESAQSRVDDAVLALSLTLHSKYEATLHEYSIDDLQPEYVAGLEEFLEPRYGRCPPLTPDSAKELKLWYQALQSARIQRDKDSTYNDIVYRASEALISRTGHRGVLLYAALEDICEVFGGSGLGRKALSISNDQRNTIERVRRPHAHGGRKGILHAHEQEVDALALATNAFALIFRTFLCTPIA